VTCKPADSNGYEPLPLQDWTPMPYRLTLGHI